MNNKYYSKSKYIKVAITVFGILIGNAVLATNAHAITIISSTNVEFTQTATLGTCRVTVLFGLNPITYSDRCELKIAGVLIASSNTNIGNVSYPSNSVTFPRTLTANGIPTVNCKYCATIKNIKVRNSSGVLLMESAGTTSCKKNKGTIT